MIFRRRERRCAEAVAERMDQLEGESWKWRELADRVGEEEAAEKFPRRSVVDLVEVLLPLCERDIEHLMRALARWYESTTARFDQEGQADRERHVSGLYMDVALNGIGNLFGFIPNDAGAYDAGLAEEGRDRGWRR